jgi:hypothetical protein
MSAHAEWVMRIDLPDTGGAPLPSRGMCIARAAGLLVAEVVTDPTIIGATVALPDGRSEYLPADAAFAMQGFGQPGGRA